jgi:putative DNA primase/helicase
MIIPFNRKFEEHEQDKHLKEKLKEELPGILNFALNAMAGVFLRGEFTKAASCEAAKAEWRMSCDQVAQFVQDLCHTGPGLKEVSSELFSRYSKWASDMGIKKTLNHNNFTSRLKRLGFEPVKGTGGIRLIAGIELKG